MASFLPPVATFSTTDRAGSMSSRSPIDVKIGGRIAVLRAEAKLDIETIGMKTGISPDRLLAIEAGAVRVGAGEMYDIAVCLRSTISEIFSKFG